MKRSVHQMLEKKNLDKQTSHQSNVDVIPMHTGISETIDTLMRSEAGALLVVHEGRVVGILSDRDLTESIALSGLHRLAEKTVAEVMSSRVIYVTPDYTLEECLSIMTQMKIRHLPVLSGPGSAPIALLSMSHIVSVIMGDQKDLIRDLVQYISGGYNVANNDTWAAEAGPESKLNRPAMEIQGHVAHPESSLQRRMS